MVDKIGFLSGVLWKGRADGLGEWEGCCVRRSGHVRVTVMRVGAHGRRFRFEQGREEERRRIIREEEKAEMEKQRMERLTIGSGTQDDGDEVAESPEEAESSSSLGAKDEEQVKNRNGPSIVEFLHGVETQSASAVARALAEEGTTFDYSKLAEAADDPTDMLTRPQTSEGTNEAPLSSSLSTLPTENVVPLPSVSAGETPAKKGSMNKIMAFLLFVLFLTVLGFLFVNVGPRLRSRLTSRS
mmetsp:Transcript_12904/g.26160  ORF Transcript_12904/g.26160 Transcript_12904/m.26160 type:complete len:242 (+) Transcript_12904:51-776(+)